MQILYTRKGQTPGAHLTKSVELSATLVNNDHLWTVTLSSHDSLDVSGPGGAKTHQDLKAPFDNAKEAVGAWCRQSALLTSMSYLDTVEGVPAESLRAKTPKTHLLARDGLLAPPLLLHRSQEPWPAPAEWLNPHVTALREMLWAEFVQASSAPKVRARTKHWAPYITRREISAREPALQLLAAWSLNLQDGVAGVSALLNQMDVASWTNAPREKAPSYLLFREFAEVLVRRPEDLAVDVPWLRQLSEPEKTAVHLSLRGFCEALCLTEPS